MGKRGASAAAASGADDGNHVDEAEADDLMVRLARWRSEHPRRAYAGPPLDLQVVGVHKRRNFVAKAAVFTSWAIRYSWNW